MEDSALKPTSHFWSDSHPTRGGRLIPTFGLIPILHKVVV
jgi:hypothetical protein